MERMEREREGPKRAFLFAQSPGQVQGLELVETGEHAGAGHTTKDVGAGALHEGHEALFLGDLQEAVHGVLVLDGGSRGHHHAPSDCICFLGGKEEHIRCRKGWATAQ